MMSWRLHFSRRALQDQRVEFIGELFLALLSHQISMFSHRSTVKIFVITGRRKGIERSLRQKYFGPSSQEILKCLVVFNIRFWMLRMFSWVEWVL